MGSDDRTKYREAAYRAWRTIRRQRREKAASGAFKLESFVRPDTVGRISHPELFPLEAERGPSPQPFRIIHAFEKTPPNIVCGRFWELRWAFGCPYNCAYCYLRGSRKGNMKPAIVKPEAVLKELAEAFCAPTFNAGAPAIFNSGELSDSLMNPKVMATIADFFETQRKHRLLVLTKSGIKAINEFASKPRKQTICAWSVNPPAIASRWEQRAATPKDRLEAAKTAKSQGYEVRFRIDPIIPVEGWKHDYESLATEIAAVGPSRVVIGTPRGLHKTILYASLAGLDMGWASYFDSQETGWGMKLPLQMRLDIYGHLYDKLQSAGISERQISICKETVELHRLMGHKVSSGNCLCYLS